MEGLRYIPKNELFECSASLSGASKFFVWDGAPQGLPLRAMPCLASGAGFDVSSRMGHLDFNPGYDGVPKEAIDAVLQEGVLTQIIFVRVLPSPQKSRLRLSCAAPGKYSAVLCFHTTGRQRFSSENFVEVSLAPGAELDLTVMQNENLISRHRSDFRLRVEEGSCLKMNIITLRGGNTSNRVHCLLAAKNAECVLNGLYLADGQQVIDTNITLLHNAPECKSRQLFKGVLAGNARSKFTGEVVVAPCAQKTEAYQANNNLLTSDTARASSDPHLVIYADDVKCSHGSTCGSIGDQELFYMRSRGISEHEARILQQQAFAGAVLEQVSNPDLRERLTSLVEHRLRAQK